MTRRALLLFLVLSLAGAMLLAGCAGSASAPVVEDLAQVADASRDAETASFSLRVEQELGDRSLSIAADGAFDTPEKRARLSVDLSSLATIFAQFDKAFGVPAGGLEGLDDPAKWKVEAIQDGTKVYLSSPLLEGALPKGKTWVSGDLEKLGKGQGIDLGQVGAFGESDPREALDILRGFSGDLEQVGRESVRGVDTTHYRATLDPEKIAAEVGKSKGGGDLVGGLVDQVKQAGLREIPVDVWVDDDMLLRRLELKVSSTQSGDATFTMELYDYGEPVDVTPPPADQVADASQLRTTK